MTNNSSQWFSFLCKETSSCTFAEEELLSHGVQDITLVEDQEQNQKIFYGQGNPSLFPSLWNHILQVLPLSQDIDWQEQWETFCPYQEEGLCRIPLSQLQKQANPKQLLLTPGAGFGDLSHPTTNLMLSLIGNYVLGKRVLDLGCGSGVLGLAAIALGATFAYCVDIDEGALLHTRKNMQLNDLQEFVFVGKELPKDFQAEILLMNMISSEQKEALSSLPHISFSLWVLSGILSSEAPAYTSYLEKTFSLSHVCSYTEGEWTSIVLEKCDYTI